MQIRSRRGCPTDADAMRTRTPCRRRRQTGADTQQTQTPDGRRHAADARRMGTLPGSRHGPLEHRARAADCQPSPAAERQSTDV
ncbi:hypothetical protein M885DRAFT_621570, partial [Pelagophyceae sp. CCMP2097]